MINNGVTSKPAYSYAYVGSLVAIAVLTRHWLRSKNKRRQDEQKTTLDIFPFTEHYAGRYKIGTYYKTVLSKSGIVYTLKSIFTGVTKSDQNKKVENTGRSYFILGGACSESFSGQKLAKVIEAAHSLESKAIEALKNGLPAPSLNTHTSVGLSPAFREFVAELGCQAPWPSVRKSANKMKCSFKHTVKDTACDAVQSKCGDADWFVSLQVEGASAVHAAFDVLLQLRALEQSSPSKRRAILDHGYAAVAETSYHGPPSTSFGSAFPLGLKHRQLQYPAPVIINRRINETFDEFLSRKKDEFTEWIGE